MSISAGLEKMKNHIAGKTDDIPGTDADGWVCSDCGNKNNANATRVVGSSPTVPTKNENNLLIFSGLFFLSNAHYIEKCLEIDNQEIGCDYDSYFDH